MNKHQIEYLIQKLNGMYRAAINSLSAKHRSELNDEIKAKLTEAGFKYSDANHSDLLAWVWTDELRTKQEEYKKQYNVYNNTLWTEIQRLTDAIHLGSSKDALDVIATVNAKIDELNRRNTESNNV